ncbi:malate dehydrogenase, cytoplasmic [Dermacentor silvarum]|uniref:malate dehydrogenase, cytoplasmic n=1 Tax=Dermacentor silvarum TaxID=543639 RepID=UPI0021007BEC|nr:malate dehydrogenase, cytoplasmic [Dermacentor silvarum]
MSTLISKPSRSTEGVSRKSAENVQRSVRKATGKGPAAAAALGSKEQLIPDEWDTDKKHRAPVAGKSTREDAATALAVAGVPVDAVAAHGVADKEAASGARPAEELSATQEEDTTSENKHLSSASASTNVEQHRAADFQMHRRHASVRPDEMNSEEEPFVKPGMMRPKPPPPLPQVVKETPTSSRTKVEEAAQPRGKEPAAPTAKFEDEVQRPLKQVEKQLSGHSTPMSKTFPAMSEQEFLSRVGSHVVVRQQEPVVPKDPIRVLVTAVTTELSYRMLIPMVRGDVFGGDQPIVLHLYDESENISDLHGIAMEIEDCSFALLKQVVFTGEDEVAFLNVDVAFLNDSVPVDGDRALFEKCVQTYAGHGKALSAHAKKTVKVIISGHPIHTNTYVCTRYAKNIPYENFTGLARLNHNRAVTLLSQRLGVIPNKIVNMIVWGHRGDMLLPDYSRSVVIKKAKRYKISDLVSRDYLDEGLPEDVKIREELVQKLTKHPGILSRAKAACDQMRDWWIGLPAGQFVTMAVLSDGLYGVPPDLVFSYPVFIDTSRSWKVVQGIALNENLRNCITESAKDLERERDEAMEICTELAL